VVEILKGRRHPLAEGLVILASQERVEPEDLFHLPLQALHLSVEEGGLARSQPSLKIRNRVRWRDISRETGGGAVERSPDIGSTRPIRHPGRERLRLSLKALRFSSEVTWLNRVLKTKVSQSR